MKFYNRTKELQQLKNIREMAMNQSQLTVVTGRRRIGKTQLLLESAKNTTALYFFVAKKSEALLCQDFVEEVQQKLGVPVLGEVSTFARLFEYLMKLSYELHFTLIIDEFQDFSIVNTSTFSEMQRIWDLYHSKSKINLIVCGSIYSLMQRIFQNAKEPLFGRATCFLHIKPFETSVLQTILKDYNSSFSPDDLLALYVFSGGVAKYVQLLLDAGATNKQKMIDFVFAEGSLFQQEGRSLLISEFGKEYATYFSILALISEGKTSRNQIENILNREIGGYLTRLEKDYNLIEKRQPLLSQSRTKQVRYALTDCFLRFWFRFMYKYGYLIEIENFAELKTIFERDYATFSGQILEDFFTQKLKSLKKYSRLGQFWDRKGENEIDLIAIDEPNKQIDFFEIKRQEKRIDLEILRKKAEVFISLHSTLKLYTVNYNGLSLKQL